MKTFVYCLSFLGLIACGAPVPGGGGSTPDASCTTDGDCADGFCGWDQANERICKPYGDLGDSCLGFVLPEFRNFCDPALHCYQDEPTGDIPGVCVETCQTQFSTDECTDGFCGPIAGGTLVCKPFAQVDESCGGFTTPEWLRICDPALECVGSHQNSPFIADAPGFCSPSCSTDSDCSAGQFCNDENGEQRCQFFTPAGVECDFLGISRTCEPGTTCEIDPDNVSRSWGLCTSR